MAGRPPKYKTPEEMQMAIDAYFEMAEKPTVCGLALELGFMDRQSILDYQHKNAFTCTIKRAKMRIQRYYEEYLTGHNAAGPIFALKNFGWEDKKTIKQEGMITHDLSPELRALGVKIAEQYMKEAVDQPDKLDVE